MAPSDDCSYDEQPLEVLVVEDDPHLASVIVRALTARGHRVRGVDRGDTAVDVATSGSFDVILLDVMLPGIYGIEACRRMRAAGVQSSIIMLTARTAVDDRVAGLDAGADDYLGKPFALKELHARIRAGRRRAAVHRSETLAVGSLSLAPDSMACARDGVAIDLRPKEFLILEHLMRNAGLVVSRDRLLDVGWEGDVDHRSNAVDAQMKRLRAKVDHPFDQPMITTVRGTGYRLDAC